MNGEYESYLELMSRRVFRVMIPVVIDIIAVSIMTRLMGDKNALKSNSNIWQLNYIVLALSFLGFVIIATGIIIFLYCLNMKRTILLLMIIAVTISVALNGMNFLYSVAQSMNLSVDILSVFLLIINVLIVGNLSIFKFSHSVLNQAFSILLCVLTSLFFLVLSDTTIWVLLCLLALYDIAVVLCPHGLLNILMRNMNERGEIMPVLIYQASAQLRDDDSVDGLSDDEAPLHDIALLERVSRDDTRTRRIRRDDGIKLGLGDFIFYGVLITRAARVGWESIILCTIAVVLGLSLTLLCLLVAQRPLPALPAPVFLGMLFFRLTNCFHSFLANNYVHVLVF